MVCAARPSRAGCQRPGQTLAIIRSTPPNCTASFRLERGRDEPPNKTQRPYWLKRLCCRRKSTICDKWELLRNELEHLNSQADSLLLTQSAPAAPAKLAGWLRRLPRQHPSFFT